MEVRFVIGVLRTGIPPARGLVRWIPQAGLRSAQERGRKGVKESGNTL